MIVYTLTNLKSCTTQSFNANSKLSLMFIVNESLSDFPTEVGKNELTGNREVTLNSLYILLSKVLDRILLYLCRVWY
jgi:hypothetical protein